MIKLSRLADYAVVILSKIASNPNVRYNSTLLSSELLIKKSIVIKLLKLLTTHAILVSERGAKGGYRLKQNLEQINLLQIIEAVDPPYHLTWCCDKQAVASKICALESLCPTKNSWQNLDNQFRQILANYSLGDMA